VLPVTNREVPLTEVTAGQMTGRQSFPNTKSDTQLMALADRHAIILNVCSQYIEIAGKRVSHFNTVQAARATKRTLEIKPIL
jgi:hypothetical protein